MPPKLGILAGGGALPARLIEVCRTAGREVFVVALEGHADPTLVADTPHAWVRLGAAGRIIECLKAAGVADVVLAGHVRRPSMTELRPDLRASKILLRLGLGARGDDALLSAVAAELEGDGFRILGAQDVAAGLLAPPGLLGGVPVPEAARDDIARGIEAARGIGALDVGQAAVVQDGIVLALEGAGGTDELLQRCGALRREGRGGVLVKVSKPGQDRRMDLPSIGPRTVELAAEVGLSGIAVEAGGTLLLDREAIVRAADAAGLFVDGIEVGG